VEYAGSVVDGVGHFPGDARHSVEYVAALLGWRHLSNALTLVAMRGRLMQQLPTGSMLAFTRAEVKAG